MLTNIAPDQLDDRSLGLFSRAARSASNTGCVNMEEIK